MKSKADKSYNANQGKVVSASAWQKSEGKKSLQMVDNREISSSQAELQMMIEHSPSLSVQRVKLKRSFERPMQRQGPQKEEELIQGRFGAIQQNDLEEEDELIQGNLKSEQPDTIPARAEESENKTGKPDHLKAGLEDLSGISMDDVRVHYNSSIPADINAHAFTQGKDIHIASGKEHLAHELNHVVQQSADCTSSGQTPARKIQKIGTENLNLTKLKSVCRQEELQTVQRYKYTNNAETAEAPNILRTFNNNWFEAKQKLVYEYESGHAEEGLQLMRKIIDYRKEKVDTLLLTVMKEISQKLGSGEGVMITKTESGYRYAVVSKKERWSHKEKPEINIIEANAPGSTNVTSDYDITFSIPSAPDLEVDAVELFNKRFMAKWKLPSSVVFDTNVYTSGFMSSEARKPYKDELNTELSQSTERQRERIQLALSLLPICQHITRRDKASWGAFKTAVIKDAVEYLRRRGKTSEDANKVMVDVSEIFAETENLFGETEEGMSQARAFRQIAQTTTQAMGIEIEILNRQYEKQLNEVKKILKKRLDILTQREAGWEQKLAANLIHFDRAQGKALVYAQEAYYSAGPVIHVVEGMQAGGQVVLTPNQKLQSILMNIGYKLQHYEHIRKEPGKSKEEQAKIGTAKYGQRVGHESVWQQEENELREVDTVLDLLKSEKWLVALKKGMLSEQRTKVAVAKEIEPPVMAMDKFVAIAIETITPYLIAQYRAENR
jgi:hypothetical protein